MVSYESKFQDIVGDMKQVRFISKDVNKLLIENNWSDPIVPIHKPKAGASSHECFKLVSEYVESNSGEMVTGYSLYYIKKKSILMALKHCCVRMKNGDIINISPSSPEGVFFVPVVYEPPLTGGFKTPLDVYLRIKKSHKATKTINLLEQDERLFLSALNDWLSEES